MRGRPRHRSPGHSHESSALSGFSTRGEARTRADVDNSEPATPDRKVQRAIPAADEKHVEPAVLHSKISDKVRNLDVAQPPSKLGPGRIGHVDYIQVDNPPVFLNAMSADVGQPTPDSEV